MKMDEKSIREAFEVALSCAEKATKTMPEAVVRDVFVKVFDALCYRLYYPPSASNLTATAAAATAQK